MQAVSTLAAACLCPVLFVGGAIAQEVLPGTPFSRYYTQDLFGRQITFFLWVEQSSARPLPLVV
jgi:hypothetical protein